jgi:hypothetical protein
MAARNELVRCEAREILRYARVAEIKKAAFGLAPIADDPREPLRERLRQKRRARAVLVFPAKYAKLMRACVCLRVR